MVQITKIYNNDLLLDDKHLMLLPACMDACAYVRVHLCMHVHMYLCLCACK